MVAVNLQAAFLSPPVAMSAFYLKGVAPSHVTLKPDLRRHDAIHVDRHPVPHHHVHLARHDFVLAEFPLWRQLSWLRNAEVLGIRATLHSQLIAHGTGRVRLLPSCSCDGLKRAAPLV